MLEKLGWEERPLAGGVAAGGAGVVLVGLVTPEVGAMAVVHGAAAAQGELSAAVGTNGRLGRVGSSFDWLAIG